MNKTLVFKTYLTVLKTDNAIVLGNKMLAE